VSAPSAPRDAGRTPADAELAAALVGTWHLRRWEAVADDGHVDRPFGEAPQGIVVYTPDGVMITTIGRRDRPAIGSGDMMAGPAEARLGAMSTFISYSGTYRVEGHDVLHAVEMSLFPDWVGGVQRRHVHLSPDRRTLELSTDPMPLRGRVARHRLTWERRG
jgi:hypothetical protein